LEILESKGTKHVEAFGDSLFVVHQVSGKYQYLDGSLNAYFDKCIDIIAKFDEFSIHHIYSHENSRSNDLAQQASGYNISNRNFNIIEKPMCANVRNLEFLHVLNAKTSLSGPTKAQTGLTDWQTSLTGPTVSASSDLVPRVDNLATNDLKHDKAGVDDWRKPIIDYL
jgi:hypothetical protein